MMNRRNESPRAQAMKYFARQVFFEFIENKYARDHASPLNADAPDIVTAKVLPEDLHSNNRLLSDRHLALLNFYQGGVSEFNEVGDISPDVRDALDYIQEKLAGYEKMMEWLPDNDPLFTDIQSLHEIESESIEPSARIAESENIIAEHREPLEKATGEYAEYKRSVSSANEIIKFYNSELQKLNFQLEEATDPEKDAIRSQIRQLNEDFPPERLKKAELKMERLRPLREAAGKECGEHRVIIKSAKDALSQSKEELTRLTVQRRNMEQSIQARTARLEREKPSAMTRFLRRVRMFQPKPVIDPPVNIITSEVVKDLYSVAASSPFHSGRNIKLQVRQLPGLVDIPLSIIAEGKRLLALYKGNKDPGHDATLGSGAFGKVKLCQDAKTGEWLAYKVLKKASVSEGQNEEDLLKRGSQYEGGFARHGSDKSQYEIVMKLVPGVRLDSYVADHPLTSETCGRMMLGLCTTIQDLHSQGVLHCDIKGDNILFDGKTQTAGPVDFGLSKMIGEKGGMAGSPNFMAPELLEAFRTGKSIIYTPAIDVYSLGMTIAHALGVSQNSELGNSCGNIRLINSDWPEIHSGFLEIMPIDSEDFKKSHIAGFPADVQKKILTVLHAMTDPDPAQRITLQNAIQEIDRMGLMPVPLHEIEEKGYLPENLHAEPDPMAGSTGHIAEALGMSIESHPKENSILAHQGRRMPVVRFAEVTPAPDEKPAVKENPLPVPINSGADEKLQGPKMR